jgi:hypothetical protein
MAKYELSLTVENANLEVTPEGPVTLSVLEILGPRGETGPKGDTGPQGPVGTTLLSGLSDVDTSNAATGRLLQSDGDNTFSFVNVSGVSDNLDDVTSRGSTTTNAITVGDLTADDTVVDSIEVNNIQQTSAEQTTLTTTTATSVASFNASSFNSGKLIIQVKDNATSEVQVSQLSVVHDTSSAHTTEYSNLFTGSNPLATFEAAIRSGFVHIDATPVSTNSTNFKVLKTLIKP